MIVRRVVYTLHSLGKDSHGYGKEEVEQGGEEVEQVEEKPKSVFANLKSYKKKVEKEDDVEVNHFLRKGSIYDFTHSLVEKLEVKAKDVDYKSFSQKLLEGFS